MKSYPYNRQDAEGRRLYRLLDATSNAGRVTARGEEPQFETNAVRAVIQCKLERLSLVVPGNSSGIKRPTVKVDGVAEHAWGDFSDDVTELDFTHGKGRGLPVSYSYPVGDDTMKHLIDAGFYFDPQFEGLMNKLMKEDSFDIEADVQMTRLDLNDAALGRVPVVLVDPVDVVHTDADPSENATLDNLVRRSSRLAMELRAEGVQTSALVDTPVREQDRDEEIFFGSAFREEGALSAADILRKTTASQEQADENISATSDLLDTDIDVTELVRGSFTVGVTDEEMRIARLKERDAAREHEEAEPAPAPAAVAPVTDASGFIRPNRQALEEEEEDYGLDL